MSHEQWDDDKIEDMLRTAPKMRDQRSKDDVLNRLEKDGLFDERPVSVKPALSQGRKPRIMTALAAIAAVCVLAIMIPSFMKQLTVSNSAEESAVRESSEMRDSPEAETAVTVEEAQNSSSMDSESVDLRTAVYPEELEGNRMFRLGLASDAADSLPVAVLIPDERIKQDFSDGTPTAVELYNFYAPLFNESAIGFAEYHPYKGEVAEQGDRVIHFLPSNQPYDMGSAALATYYASLMDTFGGAYKEVFFAAEDGSAFVFSEEGEASTPLPLTGESTQYNYFKYTQSDGRTYLVPNFRETFDTVGEALLAMKEETNDIYQSVILPEVDYEVSEDNGVAVVSFTAELDLEAWDQVQAMQMIEGMLLTASSFKMSVQFENVKQAHWQGFDFTTPLPMPIGANEMPYAAVFQ